MKKLLALLLLSAATLTAHAQTPDVTITGNVVDETGRPLAGAAVRLLTTGVDICITNAQGQYVVGLPEHGGTLTVEYLGYEPQSFHVTTAKSVDFRMEPEGQFKRSRKARAVQRRHHAAEERISLHKKAE